MSSQNRITKLILAGLLITALTTATAAASIETAGGNDIVWQNSDIQPQLTTTCSLTNATSSQLVVGSEEDNNFTRSLGEISVESTEVNGVWGSQQPVSVNYSCSNGNSTLSESKDISFLKFSITSRQNSVNYSSYNGIGFVDAIMKNESGSLGNRRGIFLNFEDINQFGRSQYLESLKNSRYSFGNSRKLVNTDEDPELASNKGYVKVFPKVRSFIDEDNSFKVDFRGSGKLSGLEKQIPVDGFTPFVHSWSASIERDPGRRMSFDRIRQGNYVYELFMDYEPSDNFPETEIDDDNFVLDVKKKKKGWNSGYKTVESNLDILTTSEPDSDSANYRVELPKVADTALEALENEENPYKFVLKYRYAKDSDTYSFKIDEMLVDKTDNPSVFSGRILNAEGNGVNADITLSPVDQDDVYKVFSNSKGRFSKDFSSELDQRFDTSLQFNKSGNSVANVSLLGAKLSGGKLGAKDISAINFNYWENPQNVQGVNIKGLKPVNLMAVRFGYDIDSVDSISMSFDRSQLAPRDLKVYECNSWNFWGTSCEGKWQKIADNQNSSVITYPEMWAQFDNVTRYETSGDKKILRNAYMVGTSSKISLQDSISLESSSIKHSGDLKASGVLVSDNGERVGDASVTLSLVQGEEVVEFWKGTSDSTGTFEFSETVDVEAGNYQLRIEASKSPFESFEMTSEKTLEVFYENGVSLDAPTSVDVVQGNESSFDLEVSNTGQQSIENIDLEVSGLEDQFYTISSGLDTLSSGDSESVEILLDLPSDYCNLPCGNPPQLDFSVTGDSGDEEVSDSLMTSIVLSGEPSGDQSSGTSGQQDESSDESSSETDDSGPESDGSPVEGVREMTGDFVEKQGELNIALGLIFIFTMMLALSVKKKKSGGSDRRGLDDGRGGGRPSLDRPPINSGEVHEVKAKETESGKEAEAASEEESRSEESEETEESEGSVDSGEGFECSVCGEEFESESGRDLHEEAVH